jgi:hypothetical protein
MPARSKYQYERAVTVRVGRDEDPEVMYVEKESAQCH